MLPAMTKAERERAIARELTLACAVAGVTQRDLAKRLSMSQTSVCRLLNGSSTLRIDVADAIARACGHRLILSVAPGNGIGLRDSGQLTVAQTIQRQAGHPWQPRLEVTVGKASDRRAIDLVLMQPSEVVAIEIERWLRDLQAQLRAGLLKRSELAERMGVTVRFILALPDTTAMRRMVAPYRDLLAATLPVSSRTAWARIRSGQPIGGDALLWVRV